jgi:hypothetical protein
MLKKIYFGELIVILKKGIHHSHPSEMVDSKLGRVLSGGTKSILSTAKLWFGSNAVAVT